MSTCFEKFIGFNRIMLDGLDRIVALKKYCTVSNSIKITQNNALFLISTNYMNTGVTFNLFMRQKNLLWKR